MVKLAILICGEYRSFDLGYKTFNIFDKLNPDYYFSTWDKSHEKNQDLGIDIQQDINEENITKFLPNVKISILNNQTYTEKGYTNTEKMYFHWKNALQMVLDSGEEYTHIFLTRPDIWLEKLNDIDDFEFLEKNYQKVFALDEEILEKIKNKSLDNEDLRKVTEFYLSYNFLNEVNNENNEVVNNDKELLNFLSLGWYIYQNHINEVNNEVNNDNDNDEVNNKN